MFLDMLMVAGVAVTTAALALWGVGTLSARKGAIPIDESDPEPIALLFENGILHHATQTATRHLQMQVGIDDWQDLCEALGPRFPDFPQMALSGSRGSQTFEAVDANGPRQVHMRWHEDLCWVTLETAAQDDLDTSNLDRDLIHLERAERTSPHPAWAVDEQNALVWSNAACDALARMEGDRPVHPFGTVDQTSEPLRVSLPAETEDGAPEWYEISSAQIGDTTYFHGKCITALHHAEEAKRTFVQTLSKTFAHLPIGLAIFDRDGQLALFNPALVDLTGLSAVFLSGRPTMVSFFDQLREHRRMPEPKNYATWREEIADVISAAADGRYEEVWTLEGGQTFRVQGRPHPDGATAFLIEDISAEVLLTRNFRAELELGQALFDSFDEAIVVFSPSGVLTFSNDAYREMWGQNPDGAFADVTICDAITIWQERSMPDAPWPEIADFVGGATRDKHSDLAITLLDGTNVHCRMRAIATGARLIRFAPVTRTTEAAQIAPEATRV